MMGSEPIFYQKFPLECKGANMVKYAVLLWTGSSVGQSWGLIIPRSGVQVPPGPPTPKFSFPLKRRAANKPDSVHPLSGTPIIHLSNQPGILGALRLHRTGSPSIPYLILLRGGFALHASFQMRRWSLTPPFHHNPLRGCLFSVALSITQDFPAPSALDKRILRPVESGLSSTFRPRPVTRASLQEKKFSKYRADSEVGRV